MAARLPCPTPWPFPASIKSRNRNAVFNCKLDSDQIDHHFQAALHRASLRLRETLRPDPLFSDPYIGCLVSPDNEMDVNEGSHKHCIATKYIDDKLIDTLRKNDGIRQIVSLTDGIDTRPYRLNWPASTVLFDISPGRIFRQSMQKLEEVGAKIPRRCVLYHVPSETSDIRQALQSKGYDGTKPSLWIFQGFSVVITLANFKEYLGIVSVLAMKGSFIFGEVPTWLVETETGMKGTNTEWMDKLFMSHGLKVEIVEHVEVARELGIESSSSSSSDYEYILFAAEQLQFSDDQMEMWRGQLRRIEEDGDEEGFEEL